MAQDGHENEPPSGRLAVPVCQWWRSGVVVMVSRRVCQGVAVSHNALVGEADTRLDLDLAA
jgi:hypothetical protein